MKVLSEKLSLVLITYDELPNNIQEEIDYMKKEKYTFRKKGMLKMLKVENQYLYVFPKYFDDSLLVSVYGTEIDRTNEDSFDTLLYDYFLWLESVNRVKYTEELIEVYVKGLEFYALNYGFENLWHVLSLAKQCLQNSYEANFSSLLDFYSLIEVLVLNDKKRKKAEMTIVKESGNKLSYFYKKINSLSFSSKSFINNDLGDYEIFEGLTRIRHKVIHGDFNIARKELEILFPIKDNSIVYKGNTEDAESSAFQDQIINLNSLISNTLVQVLIKMMKEPYEFEKIKNKNL